ncbi:TlpA disulfide reductase family protein [Chitinophaga varians]|uniref:TlpA disulfide reductase family protein n=1 Tax=Chitinophaga varians TaxID=2202339 RepID=UPI00165EE0D4|nr:TlpA disulfide reductase family protein [Chitinophaga varians]MBC9909666.1 TlpA family protein disulfide reductase [Chitinophaga varians]
MKNNFWYTVLLLIVWPMGLVLAQKPVRMGPASAEEINKAQVVVEAHMDSLKAHLKYIYAKGLGNPQLVEQYRAWMKQYPQNEYIPLAIGTAFYNAEMPQGREFLLQAANLKPAQAKIWAMLSMDATCRGENDSAAAYMRRASLADPSDAGYAARYLWSLEGDAPDYKQRVFDLVKRFPDHPISATTLYQLGDHATNRQDKIAIWEELRRQFPPRQFGSSATGTADLAELYLHTNPEKALALIHETGEGAKWKSVAEALIQADKLAQQRDYQAAINELNQIVLPAYSQTDELIVLKKAALLEKAGQVKAAYDSVAIKFARRPTDSLYQALKQYGKNAGKRDIQIDKDIAVIRNRTAVPAYPFQLGLYTSKDSLRLNDLKGKVVLLTFWFPACSPCRREFPYFQAVIDKCKGKHVAYVGINVEPDQASYVLPFLKNTRFSFIPLRGDAAFAKEHYGVAGEPRNFLIDKAGNIIFSDFYIDHTNQRTLELMIAALL